MGPFFKKSKAKVLAFLNQKGGVGKTTMVFNMAHALKAQGKRVLCLDMDPQANLTLLLRGPEGLNYRDQANSGENNWNIFHLLINSIKELKVLHVPLTVADLLLNSSSGPDFIPAGQELSGFELTVAGIQAPRQLLLKRLIELNSLKDHYDFILIDGPPTLGLIVINILCACDGVLLPFQPDQFSRKGLYHFQEVLEQIEEMGIVAPPKVLGLIPNLVDKRRKQEQTDMDQIIQDFHQGLLFQGQGKIYSPFYNKAQLGKTSSDQRSIFDFKNKDYLELQQQFSEIVKDLENF